MKDQQKMLEIAALSNIPVLLQGESGAGKEVAARFIHNHGPRRDSPFVALNCSSIPKSLAESILEGSVKGAFTGAVEEKLGLVRSAEGGTLFLDEIGELPLETQSKLLRILQEKAVTPVGAAQSIPVNFRLICATNRNLKMEIADGNFRADLFFRINVFPIEIPPLRARRDFDVVASDLWREARNQAMVRIDGTDSGNHQHNLSTEEMELLKACPWPGNVRQLKNIVEQISILEQGTQITPEILYRYGIIAGQGESFAVQHISKSSSEGRHHDWENEIKWLANAVLKLRAEVDELKSIITPEHNMHATSHLQIEDQSAANTQVFQEQFTITHAPLTAPHDNSHTYDEIEEVKEDDSLNLEEMEKRNIIRALLQSHNRRKIAAQMLGISERTLYRKIKDYGIEE